ncbi:MAG: class I SAM-dependent methyltransferase [Anaerolineales bacterium]
MPLLDHFDILAPLYETFIRPADPQDLYERIGLPVLGALLDAGGGTGRVSQYLRGKADPIVVADLSCRMLAETRRKPALYPVCSHTERLPFPDQSFARVIMVDAFHHVCNQRKTAAELWRVLQVGGRLVIDEPDVRTFAVKLIAVAEKMALMRTHFLSPLCIAGLFRYPDSRVRVELGTCNAWIIAEKE